jgi:hypothetical protein
VVRVNGHPIGRASIAAGNVYFSTKAVGARTTTEQGRPVRFPVPRAILNQGMNIVAVEVHAAASDTRPAAVTFDADMFTYGSVFVPTQIRIVRGPYLQVPLPLRCV